MKTSIIEEIANNVDIVGLWLRPLQGYLAGQGDLDGDGIEMISPSSTARGVKAPQNAHLLSSSTDPFDSNRTSHIFEALFTANEVETRYASEDGLALWQSNAHLNVKGFSSVTDLAIVATNDPGVSATKRLAA